MDKLIFERSQPGRVATAQLPESSAAERAVEIPQTQLRSTPLGLPEVSELEVVRHFTNLSKRNFSIDTHLYPLGSCTMKYNPRGAHKVAMQQGFLQRHPLATVSASQGVLACLYELQQMLCVAMGMSSVSLTPMAGAQGEFAGMSLIRAYHEDRGDHERTEVLVPTAAHGTNPATAVMCGYQVKEVPIDDSGDVDCHALQKMVGPKTAGLMLTNPSTCGVFERNISQITEMVHAAGGLVYYDGANLNAILGRVKPGEMGFDVMHMNLHKTFATPHGGGGPGAGPVGVNERLAPYIPSPVVVKEEKAGADYYRWSDEADLPKSIGRLSAFMGNVGVLLRAYFYCKVLGVEGIRQVSDIATLNANYLMVALKEAGYELAYPERRASHEFIITLQQEAKQYGVNAMDFAKRLLDYGYHAPTTYFPLLIPECWLIEPTETESKQALDALVEALEQIRAEALKDAELIKSAPSSLALNRLDDTKAARELDLCWEG